MKQWQFSRREILIACGVFSLALMAGAAWLEMREFADAMGCEDRVVQRIDSPDAARSIFKFTRHCGATAPDTLQANMQPAGSKFDSEKYPPFLIVDNSATVEPLWSTARLITIKLGANTTYRNEPETSGVRVKYIEP